MQHPSQYIAGDWGTSNFRLYLCEYGPQGATVIDSKLGLGISQLSSNNFEDHLFDLTNDWLSATSALPILLSGMIGSSIGWKESAYLECPVAPSAIAQGRNRFMCRGSEISIFSGLRTQNKLGLPDVMRGEELQLLGWMQLNNSAPSGRTLFALPGTHNKWALSVDGTIDNFITAFTGELFALLKNNSILIAQKSESSSSNQANQEAFVNGVSAVQQSGEAFLLHTLFSTRAKQVLGQMSEEHSAAYLSGLIIGADIIGATKLFNDYDNIVLIGTPELTGYYKAALKQLNLTAQISNPDDIAAAGFNALFREIYLP